MLYNKNGIQVDNTRFIVNGTTYPINSIASVTAVEAMDKNWNTALGVGIGSLILGGIVSSKGTIGGILGLAIMVGGFYLAWKLRPKKLYFVQISTSGGDQRAYASYDANEIQQIVDAINQAIINRG